MPNSPTPKLIANCPDACSLHPDKIGRAVTEALLAARSNGAGRTALRQRAQELGLTVADGTMARHIDHMRELADDGPDVSGPRPTDIQILDGIIVAGFRNSKNWKPTIKDTLDAMKLKTAMTGQSAFEDMLNALEAGLGMAEDEDEEEVESENREAVLSPEERVADDGDEPS